MNSTRKRLVILVLMVCLMGSTLAYGAAVPKTMRNVPPDTLCKATLDTPARQKCQEILTNAGHENLRVLGGEVFATPASYKKGIYVAIVNCVGEDGKIYVGKIYFKANEPRHIRIEATDKKSL